MRRRRPGCASTTRQLRRRWHGRATSGTNCTMRSIRRAARVDTACVHTYYVCMNVTLSIDDELIRKARGRAEALGTSVNQLVREYLEQFAGKPDAGADAAEFMRLSRSSKGDSRGWRFNREELYERR